MCVWVIVSIREVADIWATGESDCLSIEEVPVYPSNVVRFRLCEIPAIHHPAQLILGVEITRTRQRTDLPAGIDPVYSFEQVVGIRCGFQRLEQLPMIGGRRGGRPVIEDIARRCPVEIQVIRNSSSEVRQSVS